MKLLFAFAIFAIVLTAVYGAADPWKDFKTKHGKKYSANEDAKRKKIFLATDAKIKKHNSQEDATFKVEHNKFSDMTDDELAKFTGSVEPAKQMGLKESTITIDMTDRQLPTSLDYRTNSCLPSVKDQGYCGSCWAFAAITPIEFAKCVKSGAPVLLGEQHLMDCDPYDGGCNGGWTTNAWYYLKNVANGTAKQSLYSYNATKNTCKFTSSMNGAKFSSYGTLTSPNAANMQTALQLSGVYTDTACDNATSTNHAMVAVGYGTQNGIDHWIVRNSWGSDWGDMGYIKIQRGVNKCKIETYPQCSLLLCGFCFKCGSFSSLVSTKHKIQLYKFKYGSFPAYYCIN